MKRDNISIGIGVLSPILVIIVLLNIITINGSINYFNAFNSHLAYGQSSQLNSSDNNNTNSVGIQNMPPKRVHVGDIDVSYKIFGKGKPLLLIAGSGANMDMWDPTVLKQLSANHNVIIFDNRGKGQTSAGSIKNMTIPQFANDTAGLIDALGIQKPVDVLGVSFGGFIAQELALLHPEQVDRLIIYASDCSGKIAVPARPAPFAVTPIEQAKIVADMIFPQQWKKEHSNYLSYMPIVPIPSLKAIQLESQAISSWKGTCDRLSNISKPALVIAGTDDEIVPPAYSLPLVEKIPGAWLIQIRGGGHGLMYQYPKEFTAALEIFLSIA